MFGSLEMVSEMTRWFSPMYLRPLLVMLKDLNVSLQLFAKVPKNRIRNINLNALPFQAHFLVRFALICMIPVTFESHKAGLSAYTHHRG
jgi:hypothetical protein